MTKKILLTLYIVCLTSLAFCKLQVSNFAQMSPSLQDPQLRDIPYSIANFGFAPFGKTMVAQLQLTPNFDKQCSYDSSKQTPKEIQNSFLLIPRGDCPFVTKAINAEGMGAKMAIIMDNEEHQRGIIMKDNGYGYKVNIPSIFINYKMGQKLLNLLNSTNSKVIMKISFDNVKNEKAEVIIYMQAMNRPAYHFVQQFQPIYNSIKNYINLKLAYDVINCNRCNSQDCYANGQFCSVNYDHGFSATGKMVLDQQIRQQIMFNKYNDKWWTYVSCISSSCNRISELQQCSNKCLNNVGIKPQTIATQFTQSFSIGEENAILRQHSNILKNSGVQVFPSVTINGIRIRGTLNAQFLLDDICNSLSSPPKMCTDYISYEQNRINSHHMSWVGVILILLLCAAIFIVLFIFCRRRMKRNMTEEMQGRVDDMVSKYIEFYSQRNNRQ